MDGRPVSPSLDPGARSDLTSPGLVLWGLAGAFRFNRRFGGDVKLDVMMVSAGAT